MVLYGWWFAQILSERRAGKGLVGIVCIGGVSLRSCYVVVVSAEHLRVEFADMFCSDEIVLPEKPHAPQGPARFVEFYQVCRDFGDDQLAGLANRAVGY